jgi:hypothetical protein
MENRSGVRDTGLEMTWIPDTRRLHTKNEYKFTLKTVREYSHGRHKRNKVTVTVVVQIPLTGGIRPTPETLVCQGHIHDNLTRLTGHVVSVK